MDLRTRRWIGGTTWGAGLGVAMVWGMLDGSAPEARGYGFAPPVNVAALETARVLEIPVDLHAVVRAGEVVVRMDPAPLLEEREVASAELLAVQQQSVSDAVSESRKFAQGREGMLVDRARIQATLQEDEALLDTLRERLSLEEDLAQSGASSGQAVQEWERQMRVVEARISANRSAMAIASTAAQAAGARADAAPEANRWEVVAATRALELVEGRIQRMDLQAGIDGQVVWIYRGPGDVVPAGEPVMQVRRTGTREVVAFLNPAEATGLEAGEDATVRRATGEVVHGTLVSVGTGPQPMPAHLWGAATMPEYGVPVRVRLDAEIAPDEAVTVRL